MGICDSDKYSNKQSKLFFSIEETKKNEFQKKSDEKDNPQNVTSNNKIKLEFTLDNCNPKAEYQVSVFSNQKNPNFKTEKFKCEQNIITFREYQECEFFFERRQPIKITVYKNEQILGEFYTFLNLIIGSPNCIFRSIISKENAEFISIAAQEMCDNSFIKYIKNGLQIKFSIGIDFTDTNGNLNAPNSLHRTTPENYNDYEKAINACGSIMSYYDCGELFPVYGFGAKIQNNQTPNMCFNINFNMNNPEIYTIDKVIQEYRNCLRKIVFSRPIQFSPLIKKEINMIKNENNSIYHVLMILTSGSLTDLPDTINAMNEASNLPFSLIIIGIGNDTFEKMMNLDVNAIGLNKKRESIQFTKFNKYKNNPEELPIDVLKNIPNQIIEYYTISKMN